jgi:hypothetical protein
VHNLHGGIIQWANEGGTIVDPATAEPTDAVNPFSQQWGQYVKKELKVHFDGQVGLRSRRRFRNRGTDYLSESGI